MDNPNQPNANASIMSVGDWIITILITAIPVINIIMLFAWGFGSSTHPNKANWAKATLVWMAIGISAMDYFRLSLWRSPLFRHAGKWAILIDLPYLIR
ncbi:MAG: hypothetical protein U5L96_15930 [Owenweeksia sp.]|nr:hypothetical protein [Owenweeksia sp.]